MIYLRIKQLTETKQLFQLLRVRPDSALLYELIYGFRDLDISDFISFLHQIFLAHLVII